MKFNHLNVPSHWQNYWTRYPEGHTILEALISWVSQVDDMVDNVNNWNAYLDNFVATFEKELQTEVTQTLNDWQTSGFLNVVITEALQWQLDDYITTNDQEKSVITTQLTQTMKRTEQYQGDLLSLIHDYSVIKDNVIVRYRSPNIIDVGVFYKENEATVYTVEPDQDGWYRIKSAITRPVTIADRITKNYDSTTGVWLMNSAPNIYTTEVGATFTKSFYGTGCYLQTYANNQGGVWEIVVDDVYSKQISTWSETVNYTKVHELFNNLPEGEHTLVATFKGDDPNHVPSGGAGTSRGWLKYNSSDPQGAGVGYYGNNFTVGNGFVQVFEPTSRKEFAFLVRPYGTTVEAVWVPEHGDLTVMRNINTKINFGDREISDVTTEHADWREYPKVTIVTEFDAYNPNAASSPMWRGRVDQIIDGKGVHIKGYFEFLQDTWVASGYSGMMMIDKASSRVNAVIDSYGKRYHLPLTTNNGSKVILPNDPFSSAHFVNVSTLPTDIQTTLTDHQRDTVSVIKMDNYTSSMRLNKDGRGQVFTDLRVDGNRKTYYQPYLEHIARTGEKFSFGQTWFVGKIPEPTKILANE